MALFHELQGPRTSLGNPQRIPSLSSSVAWFQGARWALPLGWAALVCADLPVLSSSRGDHMGTESVPSFLPAGQSHAPVQGTQPLHAHRLN